MTSTPNQKKKNPKGSKDTVEKFQPPDIENLKYDENYLFECALSNEYKALCGSFDAKEHPLATYIAEKKLFNKRNEMGKTAFDLAAYLGNKDFIRTILERTNDRIDESIFDIRNLLKPSNPYNFMHHCCIWGRLEVCKFLVEHQKQIVDPSVDLSQIDLSSNQKNPNINTKTLGSVVLRTKTRSGETPKDLAKRYNHDDIVQYLNYAEKKQVFIDYLNEIKAISNDPEKNQNKLSKDDKKKLDKLHADTFEWLDKNRDEININSLLLKIKETEDEIKPIIDKITNVANETSVTRGSARSKVHTPK